MANGRDSMGRWLPGHSGNGGNNRISKLRAIIDEAVTEDDILAIIDVLVSQAQDGCVRSAKLFFEYCYGKPPQIQHVEIKGALAAAPLTIEDWWKAADERAEDE